MMIRLDPTCTAPFGCGELHAMSSNTRAVPPAVAPQPWHRSPKLPRLFAEHAPRLAEAGYAVIPISRHDDRRKVRRNGQLVSLYSDPGNQPAQTNGWQNGCPRVPSASGLPWSGSAILTYTTLRAESPSGFGKNFLTVVGRFTRFTTFTAGRLLPPVRVGLAGGRAEASYLAGRDRLLCRDGHRRHRGIHPRRDRGVPPAG